MQQHELLIDPSKCVGCGLCLKDCPENNLILLDKKAVPMSQACTKCGHCVAICPTMAVRMTGFEESPVDISTLPTVDAEQLLNALRARRSIRQFRTTPIPETILQKIIEAGRWTPTAKNTQSTSYLVLREEKSSVERLAVRFFKRLLPLARLGIPAARRISIDDHFFFKKAPVAIVILSKDKVSASLAASNMALMAEASGLGVLYSGFFTLAAKYSLPVRKALGLGRKPAVTTLVLGYSNVAYRRSAPKEAANVHYL